MALCHASVNGKKWHRATIQEVAQCQYGCGMADETPAREQDKFVLRLPDGMRDRLKAEAEANKRSMNAEILARLVASFEQNDSISNEDYVDAQKKQSILSGNLTVFMMMDVLLTLSDYPDFDIKTYLRDYRDKVGASITEQLGDGGELADIIAEKLPMIIRDKYEKR